MHKSRLAPTRCYVFTVLCSPSSVLRPLSSVLCPLSSVLCPLSSVLCLLLSVLCISQAAQPATNATNSAPSSQIVTLRPGEDAERFVREFGLKPRFMYRHALNGFAFFLSAAQFFKPASSRGEIRSSEPVQKMFFERQNLF